MSSLRSCGPSLSFRCQSAVCKTFMTQCPPSTAASAASAASAAVDHVRVIYLLEGAISDDTVGPDGGRSGRGMGRHLAAVHGPGWERHADVHRLSEVVLDHHLLGDGEALCLPLGAIRKESPGGGGKFQTAGAAQDAD